MSQGGYPVKVPTPKYLLGTCAYQKIVLLKTVPTQKCAHLKLCLLKIAPSSQLYLLLKCLLEHFAFPKWIPPRECSENHAWECLEMLRMHRNAQRMLKKPRAENHAREIPKTLRDLQEPVKHQTPGDPTETLHKLPGHPRRQPAHMPETPLRLLKDLVKIPGSLRKVYGLSSKNLSFKYKGPLAGNMPGFCKGFSIDLCTILLEIWPGLFAKTLQDLILLSSYYGFS